MSSKYHFLSAECFPVIVELNRTDNLLAHERFAHRREAAPVTRTDSYAGLNAQEKNLKKAKKFGIKMMPSLRIAGATPPQKPSDEESSPSSSDSEDGEVVAPTSPVQLRSPGATIQAPVPRPRSRLSSAGTEFAELQSHSGSDQAPIPRPRSRPPSDYRLSAELDLINSQSHSNSKQVPVPKPRSRMSSPNPEYIISHANKDNAVSSSAGESGKTDEVSSPKPTPRRRAHKQGSSSTSHFSTGSADGQTLLFEHTGTSEEVPHFKLSVGGRKGSSELSDVSSGTSLDGIPPQQAPPIPKPRKSPSSSPYHLSKSPGHRPELRVPLKSRDSKEISLDFFPSNPLSERRESEDTGESVLDFVPNGRSRGHMITNGEPYLY